MLRNARLPKDNVTREHRKALKELREMSDIVVLPADKGNATVVMACTDYDRKLMNMLEMYRKVVKDPTKLGEDRVVRKLRELVKSEELPDKVYQRIRPTGSKPPMIYGLPKIHKQGIPLMSCMIRLLLDRQIHMPRILNILFRV